MDVHSLALRTDLALLAAGRHGFAELDARRLVMAADPTYAAIRVYRSVGFTDGGTHLEATRRPGATP